MLRLGHVKISLSKATVANSPTKYRSFSSNTSRTARSKSPALCQREELPSPNHFLVCAVEASHYQVLSGLPNSATGFLVPNSEVDRAIRTNYLPLWLLFASRKPGLTLPQPQAQGCDRRRTSGILCIFDQGSSDGRRLVAIYSRHARRGISGWPNARPMRLWIPGSPPTLSAYSSVLLACF